MSKIDLIYNYRAIDTVYVIYGPEKVNGNIVVSTEGYIVNSISEVINKINAMVATLSPEITNCQSISSGLYGNMYMQIWRGDLASGSSSSPDYTQILTNINTNLTNLNDKFVSNNQYGGKIGDLIFKLLTALASDVTSLQSTQNSSYLKKLNDKFIYSDRNIAQQLEILFRCFNDNEPSSSAAGLKVGSLIGSLVLCLSGVGRNQMTNNSELSDRSMLRDISRKLTQSVSPNANITDVISSLNATIDSKQDTTIVNNDNTNLVQVEGVLDYRLKPQDSI